jgi:hypothetical protein
MIIMTNMASDGRRCIGHHQHGEDGSSTLVAVSVSLEFDA